MFSLNTSRDSLKIPDLSMNTCQSVLVKCLTRTYTNAPANRNSPNRISSTTYNIWSHILHNSIRTAYIHSCLTDLNKILKNKMTLMNTDPPAAATHWKKCIYHTFTCILFPQDQIQLKNHIFHTHSFPEISCWLPTNPDQRHCFCYQEALLLN